MNAAQPTCYHIRFTPYDISGYTWDWVDTYDKFILSEEHLDDNLQPLHHYHLYLESHQHIDTIRDKAKKYLRIPNGGKRGENNKYYAIQKPWLDPAYMCKYNEIMKSRGYTDKELMDLVISGKKKYLQKVESPAELRGVEISPAAKKPPKLPFQQQVIAIASAEWMKYRKDGNLYNGLDIDAKLKLADIVCSAMREVSRGVNPYLVGDIMNAVLYDDLEFRERVLQKIISKWDI